MRGFVLQLLSILAVGGALASPARHARIAVVNGNRADLGRFPAQEAKTVRFTVANTGDAPLTITAVRHTCGCASASVAPAIVLPGSNAVITVTTIPLTLEGAFEKQTYVESSDPMMPVLVLTFTGHAVPLIEVQPTAYLYVPRLPTRTAWRHTFRLHATRDGISLGQPVVTNNNAALTQFTTLPSNIWELAVTLQTNATPGRWKYTATLPVLGVTNHPPLTVAVAGVIGDEFYAVPYQIALPLPASVNPQPLRLPFRLRLVSDRPESPDAARVIWPAVPGVRFEPAQAFVRNTLSVTAICEPDFVRYVHTAGALTLAFEYPGAIPATLTCQAKLPSPAAAPVVTPGGATPPAALPAVETAPPAAASP